MLHTPETATIAACVFFGMFGALILTMVVLAMKTPRQ